MILLEKPLEGSWRTREVWTSGVLSCHSPWLMNTDISLPLPSVSPLFLPFPLSLPTLPSLISDPPVSTHEVSELQKCTFSPGLRVLDVYLGDVQYSHIYST